MQVLSAKYGNKEGTQVAAEFRGGLSASVNLETESWLTEAVTAWARKNTILPFETLDEAKARRKREIQQESYRVVNRLGPTLTQFRLLKEWAKLNNLKYAQQLPLTPDQETELTKLDNLDRWTEAVRTRRKTAQALVDSAVTLEEVDSVSANWPPLP